ncbi:WD40 repeat-like protein [Xylariaceae sp. FL1651]|nr:WD40 repeat-like protein [Xylariaceae sp. FL1651]
MSITIEKTFAASPVTARGQPTQLSTDAEGKWIVYASGKSIFVRSIDEPSDSKQYTEHTAQTTVARVSPSLVKVHGQVEYTIASGDVSGQVRVWVLTNDGIKTKLEHPAFSGRINDIAWDGDARRIIAVGDGREQFGKCFTSDTGNRVGEVSGHSKVINAVALRQTRPMIAATVSDDSAVCFLSPPPFKFRSKADGLHKGFVLGTAISPDGSKMITVGADKRIQLYLFNGEVYDHKTTIGEGEHTGSIFAVSWSSDSKKFVTASADQTVKLWDVEAGTVLQSWRFGGDGVVSVNNQQVGVVWPHGRSDGLIISLSLGGDLNYLKEGSEKPTRVVQGHNKSITAIGESADGKNQTLWTGSFDGRVCSWDMATGVGTVVDGQTHTNQITDFASTSGRAYSVGWDDTLRIIDGPANTFTGEALKLSAQPKGVASADGRVYVATAAGVEIYVKDQLAGKLDISDSQPTTIAAHGSFVAVGTSSNVVRLYKVDGSNKLTQASEAKNSLAQITALAFSKDGSLLAAGNQAGKIYAYKTDGLQIATDRWSAHTGRVTSIAWNEAGTHAVSGALDTHIYIWSLAKPGARVNVLNAHKDGVNGVCWAGESKVASTGGDAAVKIWNVSGLQ